MSKLEKSQEILAKEAQISALEKAIKKAKTKIKSLSTRLTKLKESIKGMHQKSGSVVMKTMERTMGLQEELGDLLDQLLKHKKILKDPEHRATIERLKADFDSPFEGLEPGEFDDFAAFMKGERRPEFEPEEARNVDIFAQFQAEPEAEEKREIRKIYLRLSHAFHPDKASTSEEQTLFHDRMQQITAAYKRHDIQTLLALEGQFLLDVVPEFAVADQSSFLDEKISHLELELNFLKRQGERLSTEIKNIRNSEMGQSLTEYDRAQRHGFGLDEEAAEMDVMFDEMEGFAGIIKEALKKGRMTPELAQQLEPIEPDDLLMDLMDLFGQDPEENEPEGYPLFSERAVVKYQPDSDTDPVPGLAAGAIGIVLNTRHADGLYYYEVAFEPAVIEGLGVSLVDEWLLERWEFGLVEVWEDELKAAPKAKLDLQASLAQGRIRIYERWVETLGKERERGERLKKLLLQLPSATDGANWLAAVRKTKLNQRWEAKMLPNLYSPPHLRTVWVEGSTNTTMLTA
jgi:predicted  nucleic acid-binding Zn-ribbon protein